MKKFLTFILVGLIGILNADGAVRTANSPSRGNSNNSTSSKTTQKTKTSRTAIKPSVSARNAKPVSVLSNNSNRKIATRTPTTTKTTRFTTARAAATNQVVTANSLTSETKAGSAYEQCKTALFTCMDQFCVFKNDKYRRCSCSDRIYDFQNISETYQKASEQLTEFSENLDVVSMTREQALAMKTASEGEDALTEDKSASKQLLQAIMNAINGEKSEVGGKYKDLNSVNMSSDMSNAFGMEDSGQLIASYNGTTLYKAVFPKCRNAVKEDCSNASLQRATNAYLMAIEQDCNTVSKALETQKKTLKSSTHQGSAMLDLARVENRQKHNSDEIDVCVVNVEKAVQSEEVCGANYHKCLDYGQFIDVTTGAPLTGVSNFYELRNLLTFKNTENIKDQKLSTLSNNRTFVQFFENKTKKFAKDALDKCSEKSDFVWQQYLDRALLDIYYAQRSKVEEIEQNCISLITACYTNQEQAITTAMAALSGEYSTNLKPGVIQLTTQMCDDYITSCNNMFGDISEDVIKKYINNKDNSDSVTSCRAVVQKCFDKFGGTGYENFYYPYSGLFEQGSAIDWFTLYKYDFQEDAINKSIVSPCAQELSETEGCNSPEMLEKVFGGFDKLVITSTENNTETTQNIYFYTKNLTQDNAIKYNREPRSNGVASETYYKIIDNLSVQCNGLNGYFVEPQYIEQYDYDPVSPCNIKTAQITSVFYKNLDNPYETNNLNYWYHFIDKENMCPANYINKVDVLSWGMCSCWENGGFRSKNGYSATCLPLLPIYTEQSNTTKDPICSDVLLKVPYNSKTTSKMSWCQNNVVSSLGQLCPRTSIYKPNNNGKVMYCGNSEDETITRIDIVYTNVPHHKTTDTGNEESETQTINTLGTTSSEPDNTPDNSGD
ncbi:MAG: hypothetical protein IKZ49_03145 [Alphaproteobacteria bacterium]|nr:hypothetical protein [Alphaproteobacteria bacterium]